MTWLKLYDGHNVPKCIPKEISPFVANNKFDDFFNYLYCYWKKYVDNGVVDFKRLINDFIPFAINNHKIIALEKSVASYMLAVLNKKNV